MAHIVMVGSGYVGLVSGACFADFGHDVVCVDKDAAKIESLKQGVMPIFEPGLAEMVTKNMREGRLSFTTELAPSVKTADVIFIAVGTPSRRGDGHADLSYVYAAAEEIADALSRYAVIVTKSTVPVGTGDEVERIIKERRPKAEFSVVSNPEFLREGAAIGDFKRPDRVVIGVEDERAKAVMQEVYRPLFLNQAPLLFTDRRTSEITKYAGNAFLAMKITFINEIADLCEKVGADVQQVARGIGHDNRIGPKFLNAGPGYGGSCFPKDTLALIKTAKDYEAPLQIVEAVERANRERKAAMAKRVIKAAGGSVAGKRIALLGLAFKPNTDDMRDAPSIDIIHGLQAAGASIVAYDPESMDQAKSLFKDVTYAQTAYACVEQADALVIITEWEQFRALDMPRVKGMMRSPVIVDLRNIYRSDEMLKLGFHYSSIGRVSEDSGQVLN
jgi:UDPglucose 6-dehydrogenase